MNARDVIMNAGRQRRFEWNEKQQQVPQIR